MVLYTGQWLILWFLPSARRVKQGDPLSLLLFIISAEVISRSLNRLSDDEEFKGFGLPKWSERINHLSYADAIILFCSVHKKSVMKIVQVLNEYGMISGQLINLSKCFIYLHEETPVVMGRRGGGLVLGRGNSLSSI